MYKYGFQGTVTSSMTESRSAIFYLDGNQTYHFVVQAGNSEGPSAINESTGISDALRK